MEREAFDLFGIRFDGHPDLTRILMPEDWEGHPLRKDYGVGRVPSSSRKRRGPDEPSRRRPTPTAAGQVAGAETDDRPALAGTGAPADVEAASVAETSEGAQELAPRSATAPGELRREVGAVLRLPEGGVLDPGDIDIERRDDETMIINMGPQHPSTHGVLRLMLELDGETVLRTKPVIGYLHTGMEKTGEELTYVQGATNVTRMDYLSPLNNELVFSLATEALLDVELPPRAVWIRMLMSELQPRLVAPDVDGDQRHGPRVDVDDDLRLPRARDGPLVLREDHRPADEPQLHPPRRRRGRPARRLGGRRRRHLRDDPTRAPTSTTSCSPASRSSASGPRASASSPPRRRSPCRRTGPILRVDRRPVGPAPVDAVPAYDELDFDVIVGTVRRQLRPLRRPPQRDPRVDQDRPPDRRQDAARRLPDPGQKVTPPPRARIDESMEALIHHFKVFTEGFRVPEGEVYVAVESPRGELGCYLVSDGTSKPYRMHIRGPSFVNLQTRAGAAARRADRRRHRRHLLGRPGDGRGRPLMAHLTPEIRQRAEALVALYPQPRSALIPLCHLAQEQDGWLQPRGDGGDRRARRRHPGRGPRHGDLLRHAPHRAGRDATSSRSARTSPACSAAHSSCSSTPRSTLGVRAGGTTADGVFTLEEAECLAACDRAAVRAGQPPLRRRPDAEAFDQLSTTSAPAGGPTRSRRHGTLSVRVPARRSAGAGADRAADGRRRAPGGQRRGLGRPVGRRRQRGGQA